MKLQSPLTTVMSATLLTLAASPLLAASGTDQNQHTGTVSVALEHVMAVAPNGSPLPNKDAECKQLTTSYQGMKITTSYSINTQTLMMEATSSMPVPNKTEPLEVEVKLSALGIAGAYHFGSFRPAVLPELYAVLFEISKTFAEPVSTMTVWGPNQGEAFNCVVSSSMSPAVHSEPTKS